VSYRRNPKEARKKAVELLTDEQKAELKKLAGDTAKKKKK